MPIMIYSPNYLHVRMFTKTTQPSKMSEKWRILFIYDIKSPLK